MAISLNQTSSKEPTTLVANMSMASLIDALHKKAIEKADPSSKGARIINSAINDSTGQVNFSDQGTQTITIVAVDPKKPIHKNIAYDLLKTYMQWFIGPNQHVISSMMRNLDNVQLKESSPRFMTFKQFLNEASDDDETIELVADDPKRTIKGGTSTEETPGEQTSGEETAKPGEAKSEEKKPEEEKKNTDKDEMSSTGYYYDYELYTNSDAKPVHKSRQHRWKQMLRDVVNTVLDTDISFTFSGLGTGKDATFTLKSAIDGVKSLVHGMFGDINPRELVHSIEKRFDAYPGHRPQVYIRDQQTLRVDLKETKLDAKQKSIIENGKRYPYFIWIKIDKNDSLKEVVTKKEIVNIINGAWQDQCNLLQKVVRKAIKDPIDYDNIIYLKDFKDMHQNTAQQSQLYQHIPTLHELYDTAKNSKDANVAFAKIEKIIDYVAEHPYRYHVRRARNCVNAWNKFRKNNADAIAPEKLEKITGESNIKAFFKPFFDSYRKAWEESAQEKLYNESIMMLSKPCLSNFSRSLVIEAFLNEEDKKKVTVDSKKIANEVKEDVKDDLANILEGVITSTKNINVFSSCQDLEKMISMLSKFDTNDLKSAYSTVSGDSNYNDMFAVGISIRYDNEHLGNPFALKESVDNDIMNILFGSTYFNNLIDETDTSDNKSESDKATTIENTYMTPENVESIKNKLLNTIKIYLNRVFDTNYNDLKIFSLKKLSVKNDQPHLSDYTFVVPFKVQNGVLTTSTDAEDEEMPSSDKSKNDKKSDAGQEADDLYLVPLRKHTYSQDERLFRQDKNNRW